MHLNPPILCGSMILVGNRDGEKTRGQIVLLILYTSVKKRKKKKRKKQTSPVLSGLKTKSRPDQSYVT